MPGKLADIQLSAVEKLEEIKKQKVRLEKFVDKAKGQEDSVSDVVYEKVMGDYQVQLQRLADDALPRKTEARQAYSRFRTLHQEMERAFEQARANKEELEFRHQVGEIPKTELATKVESCEKALEDCRSDLSDAENLKKRFVNAFDSEKDLEVNTVTPPATTQKRVLDATNILESPIVAPAEVSTNEVESSPTGEAKTTLLTPEMLARAREENGSDSKPVIPDASLIQEADGEAPVKHTLVELNYIGRTAENQIQIELPGVSRVHALITAGEEGFSLKDLGSQNGTFVNDERITEHVLEDGDRIRITSAQLVFRRA